LKADEVEKSTISDCRQHHIILITPPENVKKSVKHIGLLVSDTNVSQANGATRLSCTEIFNDCLVRKSELFLKVC